MPPLVKRFEDIYKHFEMLTITFFFFLLGGGDCQWIDKFWIIFSTLTCTGDWVWVLSKFNGTSTPKGSYRAKTGDNVCNVNSSRYCLSTALCESIRYQAKSEQNARQDLIPRVRHGEAGPQSLYCNWHDFSYHKTMSENHTWSSKTLSCDNLAKSKSIPYKFKLQ